MCTASWMGEAALQTPQGWLRGAPSSLAPAGLFFFCLFVPSTKQPSPAPAGLQLFAGCSCRVVSEGGELRLPWPGRVLSQTLQQGIGVRKAQGTGTSPYSSAGCSPPQSPPHRCPAGLHGPVLLPTPYNGRVWPGWVPRGLLRAIFGVRKLAGCPGAGPLIQQARHEGSRQGEPKGSSLCAASTRSRGSEATGGVWGRGEGAHLDGDVGVVPRQQHLGAVLPPLDGRHGVGEDLAAEDDVLAGDVPGVVGRGGDLGLWGDTEGPGEPSRENLARGSDAGTLPVNPLQAHPRRASLCPQGAAPPPSQDRGPPPAPHKPTVVAAPPAPRSPPRTQLS